MLIEKLNNQLLANKPSKSKDSFWASESETDAFEIYHRWIGTPPTNPFDAKKLIMFEAAKMIEVAIIKYLNHSIRVIPPLSGDQHYISFERAGIKVSGYMDALIEDEDKTIIPLEVKTIYGDYQAKELTACKPRLNYLKQLAIYMDARDAKKGILFYMDRGTGQTWEFNLTRDEQGIFHCLNINFNLNEVYERWAKIYKENIIPRIEPKSDYRYKYPLEQIVQASKSDITAARMNRATVGDWQVKYSPFKNLIIEREGCGLGYSDEELKIIKALTRGYSTK